MNILLTNRCSRHCRYCFATERADAPPRISREDFSQAVAFARTGPLREVGILGGEPSLHPEFAGLLEVAWDAGFHTKVFSNGMWREGDVEALADRDFDAEEGRRFHVVLNVNEPGRTPPAEQRAQDHLLRRLGPSCTLSFNISRVDFDPRFLVDIVLRYRTRRRIRLGIAQPLARGDNEHVAVVAYPELAETVLGLADRCDQHDIRLGFDCGFTVCMFSAEQHGRLLLSGARFRARCAPTVDVGTDLWAWACFPLSTVSESVRIADFVSLEALVRHLEGQHRALYGAGVLLACADCRHLRRHHCSGGCAAHVYRAVSA